MKSNKNDLLQLKIYFYDVIYYQTIMAVSLIDFDLRLG